MSEAILEWAREELGRPFEPTVIKDRPWARTWRLRTADGVGFLKACGPATHYEAPLMAGLYRVAPALVAPVLASRADTGWLLLGDAGETLQERLAGEFDVDPWVRMLARFAQLQTIAEPLTGDLIAAGVPDERPDRLVDVLKQLLSDSPNLAGLTEAERQTLLAGANRWADAAAELAELPVAASVQHGDLHAGNVSLSPSPGPSPGPSLGDGQARFFDLGDASIAHPFTTLLVPLQMARHLGADDAQIVRLRDGYLEVFSDRGASLRQLRRGLDIALWTAVLPKAAAWDRALLEAPAGHAWGQPVLEYLRDLF